MAKLVGTTRAASAACGPAACVPANSALQRVTAASQASAVRACTTTITSLGPASCTALLSRPASRKMSLFAGLPICKVALTTPGMANRLCATRIRATESLYRLAWMNAAVCREVVMRGQSKGILLTI